MILFIWERKSNEDAQGIHQNGRCRRKQEAAGDVQYDRGKKCSGFWQGRNSEWTRPLCPARSENTPQSKIRIQSAGQTAAG